MLREGGRRLDFLIPSWLEDPTAFSQRPDLGFGAIASVTVANAVVSVVCIAIFEILRHRGAFFCPKAAYQPERVPAVVHFNGKAKARTYSHYPRLLQQWAPEDDASVRQVARSHP